METAAPAPNLRAAGHPATLDPEADALILQTRERIQRNAEVRERLASIVMGSAFLAAATAAAVLLPAHRHPQLLTVALYAVAYAVVSRVEFEIGTGAAIPTQLVLVSMFFVLSPGIVPLVVAAALLLRSPADLLPSRMSVDRSFFVPL